MKEVLPSISDSEAALIDVRTGKVSAIEEFKGSKGTVVVFMCNHCPYVLHILDKLVEMSKSYLVKNVQFIAISSNDVSRYPDDSPEKMSKLAEDKGFVFPYLFDASQKVAKLFKAVCTPDIYVYSSKDELFYHGQFDSTRPDGGVPSTGESLLQALELLIAGGEPPTDTQPCLGCSIKWFE
jgi:thiol-disulfide isomerase/thioredoxin